MPQPLTAVNSSAHRAITANTMYKVEEGLLLHKLPPCPPELNAEGEKWWNYYCTLMIQGRVLSRMFLTSLTNLCIQHMIRDIILDTVKSEGAMLPVSTVDAEQNITIRHKLNPLVDDLEDCLLKMDKLLTSCGFTPYSAKVNNIDTKGNLTKVEKAGPPKSTLTPEKPTSLDLTT